MIQTDTKLESKEVILCVDIDADELPPSIRTLMTDHAFELVHCASVYEALARIKTANPVIALVRVDWLTAPEFEFFSICTRSYPQLCIFVVGEDRCGAKIDRAIEAGASARLSAKAVEGILAEHCCEASSTTFGEAGIGEWGDLTGEPTGGEGPGNNSDTFASPDNEFDAESEMPDLGSSTEGDRDSDVAEAHSAKAQSAIDPGESGGIEPMGAGVQPASFTSHRPTDAHGRLDTSEDLAEGGREPLAGWDVEDASDGDEVDRGADDETDEECRPVIVPWADSSRSANRVPPMRSGPTRPADPVVEMANSGESDLQGEDVSDDSGSNDSRSNDSVVNDSASNDSASNDSVVNDGAPQEMFEDDPPLLSPEELSLLLGE